jgi:hypothetical protein
MTGGADGRPYDVAPKHFEVIFTYTSKEDVSRGYVCGTPQPMPLHPPYVSGVPLHDYVSTQTNEPTHCPESQRTPTKDISVGANGIKPEFNTPYTMRWCMDAEACKRLTNTYQGPTKGDGLIDNKKMSVYSMASPFLVEYDGYIRAVVVADNYQNSVDVSVEMQINQVAPVRIYPAGTAVSGAAYTQRSQWISETPPIFLWTPTPNAEIMFYETETAVYNHVGLAAPGSGADTRWTCFGTSAPADKTTTACADPLDNFTRTYSIDIFTKATKTAARAYSVASNGGSPTFTDADERSEFFEVQVAKPVAWPLYETQMEWQANSVAGAVDTTANSIDRQVCTWTPQVTNADATCAEIGQPAAAWAGTDVECVSSVGTCQTATGVARPLFDTRLKCEVIPDGTTVANTFTSRAIWTPATVLATCSHPWFAACATRTTKSQCDVQALSKADTAGTSALTQTATSAGVESNRVSALAAGQQYQCDRVFGVVDPPYDLGETQTNCLDKFYLDSVKVFLATETPTDAPMTCGTCITPLTAGATTAATDAGVTCAMDCSVPATCASNTWTGTKAECLATGTCAESDGTAVGSATTESACTDPVGGCDDGAGNVVTDIGGSAPTGATCTDPRVWTTTRVWTPSDFTVATTPLRTKIIQYSIGGDAGLCSVRDVTTCNSIELCEWTAGSTNACTLKCGNDASHDDCKYDGATTKDYAVDDSTAPTLYQSDRVKVGATKLGLTNSEDLYVYYRVKFATPGIVDDADELDVTGAQPGGPAQRRDAGDKLELTTAVTVLGKARHGKLSYSIMEETDSGCDCRAGLGHINGYGTRAAVSTASCNWQEYDDNNRPTLTETQGSVNFCAQIVANDGTSVNSDVVYRKIWVKTPSIIVSPTPSIIYTSDVTVTLSTSSTNAPTIYYVLKDPGTDWVSTTEPPVRQAALACPYWSCGEACPQGCRCPKGCTDANADASLDDCADEAVYPAAAALSTCPARTAAEVTLVGGLFNVDTRQTTWAGTPPQLTVSAHPGLFSAPSVLHSRYSLYGAFVWGCGVLTACFCIFRPG